MLSDSLLPFALVQAEVDFAGLAARLRDDEGRAAETDRAAREALHRCAQTEAQLQSTEVCWRCFCCQGYRMLLLQDGSLEGRMSRCMHASMHACWLNAQHHCGGQKHTFWSVVHV